MPSLLQSNCATDIHSLSGSMADKQQCRQAGRRILSSFWVHPISSNPLIIFPSNILWIIPKVMELSSIYIPPCYIKWMFWKLCSPLTPSVTYPTSAPFSIESRFVQFNARNGEKSDMRTPRSPRWEFGLVRSQHFNGIRFSVLLCYCIGVTAVECPEMEDLSNFSPTTASALCCWVIELMTSPN